MLPRRVIAGCVIADRSIVARFIAARLFTAHLFTAHLFTIGAVLALSSAAMAQVTVNPGALELLPQAPRRPAPGRPTPPARAAVPSPAPAHPAPRSPVRPTPAPPPPQAARPPAVPVTPPAILALPPPIQVPVAHPPPVPVVPTSADAPGAAAPLPGGLRLTFGPDRADLNPVTEAALRQFARGLKDSEASVNVYAYATGSTEDPSTPRRLSLARALAARAVLINEGIASTRIYPRALGPVGGDTDRDRVDVVGGTPGPPPSGPPASGPPASGPAR